MKKILALILTLVLLVGVLSPLTCTVGAASNNETNNYKGKVISIMGDSISTFAGYIPVADGFNLQHYTRYPQDNLLTDVNETWWMQVLTRLDAKLGVNESWRSTEIYNYIDGEVNSTYDGTKACMASTTRIQNLGSNGTPDVILFYGGTNDITQRRRVGTFDPSSVPAEVDLTSVKWDTVADAYVDAIMRMQYYYPDALIVAMFPAVTSSNTKSVIKPYTEMFTAVCDHFGVPHLDLRESGVTTSHLPDGTHPNAAGMDLITEAVLKLLNECEIEAGETTVHSITHNLSGAKSSRGYYKGVTHGKAYTTELSGTNLSASVTMGGMDITATALKNNVITIPEVNDDVVITATGKVNNPISDPYLQPLPDEWCCKTNLWPVLTHNSGLYKGSEWGTSNDVHSVTIPVNPGDRIWATSFQNKPQNGNATTATDSIRVTYFDNDGVLKSVAPATNKTEFQKDGYLTVPAGAVSANIPMWNNKADNELYILTKDHVYEDDCDTTCNCCGETRTVAGHVYDNACDPNCNNCDEPRTVTGHAYDNACDTDCNNCGDVRTVAGHAYDNASDPDCNECGAVRTITPAKKNGWVSNGGKWYYYENDVMVKNAWRRDSVGWVYLAADGAMKTNAWVRDSIGWCYVGANGYAVTNCWKKDSVGWCYLNASGSMTKNAWVKDGGKLYYVNASGYKVIDGWARDSKGWVYLGSDGTKVINKWVRDSIGWCYVGADGYAVTNCWKKDSVGWCYLNASGSMTKNAWVNDGGNRYYLNGSGYRVTGTKVIGGKTYKFNSNGILVS